MSHAAIGQEECVAELGAAGLGLSDGEAEGSGDVHPGDFGIAALGLLFGARDGDGEAVIPLGRVVVGEMLCGLICPVEIGVFGVCGKLFELGCGFGFFAAGILSVCEEIFCAGGIQEWVEAVLGEV